jgi:hypothetical protein
MVRFDQGLKIWTLLLFQKSNARDISGALPSFSAHTMETNPAPLIAYCISNFGPYGY